MEKSLPEKPSVSQFDIAEAQLSLEVLKQQGYLNLTLSDDEPFARLFFSSLLRWREAKAKRRIAEGRARKAEERAREVAEQAHRQASLDWLEKAVPRLLLLRKLEIKIGLDQNLTEAAKVLKRTFRDYMETSNPEAAKSMKVYASAKRRTVLIVL